MPTKKELDKLTKEMLFAKYDGRCAFCGYPLGEKWHIWYIKSKDTVVTAKQGLILGDDSYENKEPACISCNTTRNNNSHGEVKLDVEGFRRALYHEFEFLKEGMAATYYKKMIKFGLIEETGKEIVFYFEKIEK